MRGVAAALVFVAACGGRIRDDAGGTNPDAGTDGSSDSAAASKPNCAAGSVRLCGGACGEISGCAGSGCTPLLEDDGTASPIGICWADLADDGSTPCALCDDNEGCVARAAGEYVCVPLEVCAAIASLGTDGVCWYGDKVAYDGRAEATSTSCAGPMGIVCGGACGACSASGNVLPRCVGRGPDHPNGICPVFTSTSESSDPNQFPRCSMTASGYSLPCPTSGQNPFACVVYPSPPADQVVAMQNGYCLDAAECTTIAQTLPGGVDCYAPNGLNLSP